MVKKSVRKSVQNNENTKKQLKNQEKAWNSETEKGLNEIDIEMLNAHNIIYCGLFLDMIKFIRKVSDSEQTKRAVLYKR